MCLSQTDSNTVELHVDNDYSSAAVSFRPNAIGLDVGVITAEG